MGGAGDERSRGWGQDTPRSGGGGRGAAACCFGGSLVGSGTLDHWGMQALFRTRVARPVAWCGLGRGGYMGCELQWRGGWGGL